ncbi:MAG: Wzz/FepE/Etk N-terminal domain-containing protein [Chitinispirillaceae bacterium]|nr:Wzz/FepE/Etk N-terminal domain-containing protein [Chitinispirillaceae bacterium]
MVEKKFDFSPYIIILLKHRWSLIFNFIIIFILSIIYAFFLVKKQYKSEITFLPPVSGENTLNISQFKGVSFPLSIFSTNISPEQIEILFFSKEIREKIITKYNLYKNYKLEKNINKFERALKILAKNLYIITEEKGGFAYSQILSYTIVSYHTSPDTARLIAEYSFFLLDSTVRAISMDRAHRNRIFVEEQLLLNRKKLDSLQSVLTKFQTENKAYNLTEQMKLSLNVYANLKSQEILNDIRLKSIEDNFPSSTPQVMELKIFSKLLKEKLKGLESQSEKEGFPSLQQFANLLPDYYNLLRDIEVQNQLILLLIKEFEEAKIQEHRDVSPLFILDKARTPEYKARPKRIILVAVITFTYIFALIFFIIVREFYRVYLKNTELYQKILKELSVK